MRITTGSCRVHYVNQSKSILRMHNILRNIFLLLVWWNCIKSYLFSWTDSSINNSLPVNLMMNWLPTDAQLTAAPSRHTMALCLLSRGSPVRIGPGLPFKSIACPQNTLARKVSPRLQKWLEVDSQLSPYGTFTAHSKLP